MMILERLFRLSENHTSARTEVLAGLTTFLTIAYIIVVQPAVLSGKMFGKETGMDFGAVTTATCLSAALATAIMALYARYPIAQAPGMGENFFFVFSAVPAAAAAGIVNAWQVAFIKDNRLPRAKQAMLSDAVGTVAGAALGTSTVTSFIESAAGVQQGGRTGLTGLVVAALFLLALFFSPLIAMVGSYPPITAPALVIVGAMMIQNVTRIEWQDASESVPAFLTLIGIPLSYSIADGMALGFISYPIIKLFSGKWRQVGILTYVLGILLLGYFLFIRGRI